MPFRSLPPVSWRRWALPAGCLILGFTLRSQAPENPITSDLIATAERLFGLSFTSEQRELMRDGVRDNGEQYARLHQISIPNSVPPALQFNPIPVGMKLPSGRQPNVWSVVRTHPAPAHLEDLAFASVAEWSAMIRRRRVTSEQLTRMYLNRLKRYDEKLHCVISYTEESALREARQADREIAAGRYRGPLHGIPYGAKDLLSVKGTRTTWGSGAHKEQVIDEDAAIIQKLRAAGAVLIAKLTLGELALGDVWYGEKTRNPWNVSQGSSGSSAGSAAATAAGLVPFAIGTETLGSIVSPSTRCGVTGLRPTYGRVSRRGAMALSWSMDKIGPICRRAEDCAMVFSVIQGRDAEDPHTFDVPFHFNAHQDVRKLRVGYLKNDFDNAQRNKEQNEAALAQLRQLGVELVPIELPKYPVSAIRLVLDVEAASAFDELTRSGRDALLVQQSKSSWPNFFRVSRFIPAVEYVQMQRLRQQLIQDMGKLMENVDVYVAPSFGGDNLVLTNLTGNPCVVVPSGFTKEGSPVSISFVGQLFGEAKALALAKAYQDAAGFYKQHPVL